MSYKTYKVKVFSSGKKAWYLNDTNYTEAEWKAKLNPVKELSVEEVMQDNTLEDAGTFILAMHGYLESLYRPDALDQVDTISIEELDQDVVDTDLTRAGIAETTSVDKFIQMNGDTHHVERI